MILILILNNIGASCFLKIKKPSQCDKAGNSNWGFSFTTDGWSLGCSYKGCPGDHKVRGNNYSYYSPLCIHWYILQNKAMFAFLTYPFLVSVWAPNIIKKTLIFFHFCLCPYHQNFPLQFLSTIDTTVTFNKCRFYTHQTLPLLLHIPLGLIIYNQVF